MNKRILIIFTTCAPNPAANIEHWHRNFENILQQDLSGFVTKSGHVTLLVDYIISDCMSADNHMETARRLANHAKSTYPENGSYVISLRDKVSVQMSFNYTCKYMTENFGKYDFYIFWPSDVSFKDHSSLKNLIAAMDDNDAIMCPANSDDLPHKGEWAQYQRYNPNGGKVSLPVSYACNGVFIIFSGNYAKKYKFKPWPDILKSNCSEVFLSYTAAAIKKKWSIQQNIKVEPGRNFQDGPSLFSRTNINNVCTIIHINPFNNKYDLAEIVKDGYDVGLGFEELGEKYPHNPNAYSGLYAKTDDLYKYILENMYIKEEDFNYNDYNLITFYEVK